MFTFFSHSTRTSGKSIIFNDKNINKNNVHKNKKLFKIDDIDINEISVSKKELYGQKSSFKYFIGYKYNDVIRPLYIKLPQMIGYAKYFDSSKTMYFKLIDNKLLRKYTIISGKLAASLKNKK